jgi:hypothetical protein
MRCGAPERWQGYRLVPMTTLVSWSRTMCQSCLDISRSISCNRLIFLLILMEITHKSPHTVSMGEMTLAGE